MQHTSAEHPPDCSRCWLSFVMGRADTGAPVQLGTKMCLQKGASAWGKMTVGTSLACRLLMPKSAAAVNAADPIAEKTSTIIAHIHPPAAAPPGCVPPGCAPQTRACQPIAACPQSPAGTQRTAGFSKVARAVKR